MAAVGRTGGSRVPGFGEVSAGGAFRFDCADAARRSFGISSIAEGHPRSSTRDDLRFLSIVRGSPAELDTQLLIARRLRFAEEDVIEQLEQENDRVGRMLRNLVRSLSHKLA